VQEDILQRAAVINNSVSGFKKSKFNVMLNYALKIIEQQERTSIGSKKLSSVSKNRLALNFIKMKTCPKRYKKCVRLRELLEENIEKSKKQKNIKGSDFTFQKR